jgi:hypothetical protein
MTARMSGVLAAIATSFMAISSSDRAPAGVEAPCEVVRRLPAVSGADTMIYLQIQWQPRCEPHPSWVAAARERVPPDTSTKPREGQIVRPVNR